MHWELIVAVIGLYYAYQFYRDSKKPVHRFPSEFEEVIRIIEDTPGTFIHYPQRISDHLFEFDFDVKLNTGKAKGRARLNFKQKDLIIRISYPVPIPEKYMEPCYEFIDSANETINISKWKLELNHTTRLITFVFGIDFEPGIGVLPPYSEYILKYAKMQMNHFLKGIQKITLNGVAPEDAMQNFVRSNILSS